MSEAKNRTQKQQFFEWISINTTEGIHRVAKDQEISTKIISDRHLAGKELALENIEIEKENQRTRNPIIPCH